MSTPYDDDEGEAPTSLPQVGGAIAKGDHPKNATEAARQCDLCKSINIRVFSNFNGRQAQCMDCKHMWGLALALEAVFIPGNYHVRGLKKQTMLEPDWDLAFEDLDDTFDPHNDPDKGNR